MIVLLMIAVVLFLLAILQIGVKLTYEDNEFALKFRVGFFRLSFSKKEKNDGDKDDQPKEKEAVKPDKTVKSAKIKSWLKTLWLHRGEVGQLIGKILGTPVLDVLKLHMIVGASDPEVCALNYGKANAAVGSLLPVIENLFGIRKRDIRIDCDFMMDSNIVSAHAEITLRVYQLVSIAVAGLKLLTKLMKTQKSEFKAVQEHESSSS